MKVTFDIECTPEEARAFFGLPNVAPMQDKIMKELENQMLENIRSLEPEAMLKTWLPATIQGWGEVQKMFWDHMGMTTGGVKSSSGTKKTGKSGS